MCVQLLPPAEKRGELSLVEVGPRCCLNPIRVFAGSFGGPVIYENASFVSPFFPPLRFSRFPAAESAIGACFIPSWERTMTVCLGELQSGSARVHLPTFSTVVNRIDVTFSV